MKEQLFNFFSQLNNDKEFVSLFEEEYRELVGEAYAIWQNTVAAGRTPTEATQKAQHYINMHPFINPLLNIECAG